MLILDMLSIIIPCLNESNNLKKLIPYLHAHTSNKKIEIIVVDAACSSDDTESICLAHDAKYHRSTTTQRSRQLNEGASIAKYTKLIFIHADVRPPMDYVHQIVKAGQKGIEVGFFAYRFDSPNKLLKINAYCTKFDGLFAGGGDQCQFMSKTIFDQLGGYNDEFVIMEDFNLYDRIKKTKIPYVIIQSPATVSARKYNTNSYLKVNAVNLLVFLQYKCKVHPSKLRAQYKKWLN